MPTMHAVGKDLLETSLPRLVFALAAPFVSVAAYFFFALNGHWAPALAAVVFLSFITYGSTSHDLVHGNLGLRPTVDDAFLTLIELLALRSGRAYKVSHLAHHRHFPGKEDAEGAPAHWPLWRVLVAGPVYIPSLLIGSFRRARAHRLRILLESAACVAYVVGAVVLFPRSPAFLVYAVLVYAGTWVLPFGLVFVQHVPNADGAVFQTRRFRGRLVPRLFLDHLYHLEHHLYPRVPAHHWRELSRRIDPPPRCRGSARDPHPMSASTRGRATRGWAYIAATGALLVLAGVIACVIALTVKLMPYDVRFLGMTADQLCDLHGCRIVHFMVHDRISFGGSLIAVGSVYIWLAVDPLRAGERWAYWTLLASGCVGFASFLSYIGFGYLDVWHARATLGLLVLFVAGLVQSRSCLRGYPPGQPVFPPSMPLGFGTRAGGGRTLLLATATGMVLAGATISVLGATTVFVPQDLVFMGVDVAELRAVNERLVPLIAHDRAGFGGGLVSTGVAIFGPVYCRLREAQRTLLWVLGFAGSAGFGFAIGIHPLVGYVSFSHLFPALVGALLFATGMGLLMPSRTAAADTSGAG